MGEERELEASEDGGDRRLLVVDKGRVHAALDELEKRKDRKTHVTCQSRRLDEVVKRNSRRTCESRVMPGQGWRVIIISAGSKGRGLGSVPRIHENTAGCAMSVAWG
eukprot:1117757-Rhodomonas_salina.1